MYKFNVMYVMEDGKKKQETVEALNLEEAREKVKEAAKNGAVSGSIMIDPELLYQLREDSE